MEKEFAKRLVCRYIEGIGNKHWRPAMTAKYRKALHRRIRYLKFGGPYMAERFYYMDHHYRARYSANVMASFTPLRVFLLVATTEYINHAKRQVRFAMERRAALTAYPPLPGRVRK